MQAHEIVNIGHTMGITRLLLCTSCQYVCAFCGILQQMKWLTFLLT